MKLSASFKLAAAFFLFAGIYIVFSDRLTLMLVKNDIERYNSIQTYKGIGFVLAASLLIYFLANRFNRDLLKANKANEEALRRYNVLGMATNDGIWDLNLRTGQSYTNRALLEMFGYSADELTDNYTWWTENLHPDDKKRMTEKMELTLTSDAATWHDEYRFRCKNGQYRYVLDRGYIMRDPSGLAHRLIGVMQDVTEQRELQRQVIADQIRHKNEMAHGVITAQEEERKKISEELHDNITQMLSVVKLYVENAKGDPKQEEELLQKSSSYLSQVIDELRGISRSLVPPAIRDIGLVVALQDLAGQFEEANSVTIRVDARNFDETSVTEQKKLLLYRAIQESIYLAVRHTGATEIEVALSNADGHVHAVISDNGRGFDSTHMHSVKTLGSIKNRLESIDGHVFIDSLPGGGTSVNVRFVA